MHVLAPFFACLACQKAFTCAPIRGVGVSGQCALISGLRSLISGLVVRREEEKLCEGAGEAVLGGDGGLGVGSAFPGIYIYSCKEFLRSQVSKARSGSPDCGWVRLPVCVAPARNAANKGRKPRRIGTDHLSFSNALRVSSMRGWPRRWRSSSAATSLCRASSNSPRRKWAIPQRCSPSAWPQAYRQSGA